MSTDSSTISLVAEAPEPNRRVGATPPGELPSGETVLLVEDDEMVRTLARHILELVGYEVLEAGTGAEALKLCEDKKTVHLLLTDVVMPQMNGPQLREEVTKLFPDIRVLYMSGYTDNIILGHGVSQEEVPFLQKPFSPEALALKVRELLETAPLETIPQSSSENSLLVPAAG